MKTLKGKEKDSKSAREGFIGRGYSGWRGVAQPAFSVDVAALCGPPYTDNPTNESDLVSTSQKNSISTSLCSPEQSISALIFQHSFYLNANTAQHDFCQGDTARKILGKMEWGESEREGDRQKDSQKDLVFNLSGVIVPLVEELLALCRPAGHQRKSLTSKLLCTHSSSISVQ